MAQGRSTEIISMIMQIRTSRLSIRVECIRFRFQGAKRLIEELELKLGVLSEEFGGLGSVFRVYGVGYMCVGRRV